MMGNRRQPLILVVDDDQGIRSVMQEIFARKCWPVVLAEDGVEGVEAFQRQDSQIDLVIINATMPKMDGYRAIRLMRSINQAVPIILMSGYPKEALDQSENLVGINAFLHKPFVVEDLYKLVQKLIYNGEDTSLSL